MGTDPQVLLRRAYRKARNNTGCTISEFEISHGLPAYSVFPHQAAAGKMDYGFCTYSNEPRAEDNPVHDDEVRFAVRQSGINQHNHAAARVARERACPTGVRPKLRPGHAGTRTLTTIAGGISGGEPPETIQSNPVTE